MYARIIGTGSYLPENIITNKYLEDIVDTSDEWIQSRTGIIERRVVLEEKTSDLALKAAENAIKAANIKPEDIELIIVATITPDSFMPSTACIVQKRIEATNALAFDISAACSGLIFGMDIAAKYIQSGSIKHALVIGAETMSKSVDWTDRNTCVLFGDGASAVVLEASEETGIKEMYMGCDGDLNDYLALKARPIANLIHKEEALDSYLTMDGQEIFKFAARIIKKSLKELEKRDSVSLDEIKYIVPHQANYRIMELVANKMNIPIEKFYMNLEKVGNTSSASIGIALDEMIEKNLLKKNDKVILIGFGGGLTWGAMYIEI